eukprot:m.46302 g.46302  ORF g.46302 m.46302 type:complete len:106 (+) comp17507_c0_seq1:56-373(+)
MDEANLSPEDLAFKKKFGRLPPKKKNKGGALGRLAGGQGDRKFFDSADHALGKAGMKKADTGSVVPTPQNIPKKDAPRPSSMVKSIGSSTNLQPDNPAPEEPVAS